MWKKELSVKVQLVFFNPVVIFQLRFSVSSIFCYWNINYRQMDIRFMEVDRRYFYQDIKMRMSTKMGPMNTKVEQVWIINAAAVSGLLSDKTKNYGLGTRAVKHCHEKYFPSKWVIHLPTFYEEINTWYWSRNENWNQEINMYNKKKTIDSVKLSPVSLELKYEHNYTKFVSGTFHVQCTKY